jgi:hypothetical protein
MKVWLIMCEQWYANYARPWRIFDSQEQAEKWIKECGGSDFVIYTAELNANELPEG